MTTTLGEHKQTYVNTAFDMTLACRIANISNISPYVEELGLDCSTPGNIRLSTALLILTRARRLHLDFSTSQALSADKINLFNLAIGLWSHIEELSLHHPPEDVVSATTATH